MNVAFHIYKELEDTVAAASKICTRLHHKALYYEAQEPVFNNTCICFDCKAIHVSYMPSDPNQLFDNPVLAKLHIKN